MTVAIWLMILSCWILLLGVFYNTRKIHNILTDKTKHDKEQDKMNNKEQQQHD